MPRSAPPSVEISKALIDFCHGADRVIAWSTAASIVRDRFLTNNSTARRWLRDATLEADPKVVQLYVHPGGVLSGIVRRNEPGHAWSVEGGPDYVLAEFDQWGYAPTYGRLRVDTADGTWWMKETPPPPHGAWHTTDRLWCVAVDLCLAGAASKCYDTLRREDVRREWMTNDLPHWYGLMLEAGIAMPADFAPDLDTVLQVDAQGLHNIARVLRKGMRVKPFPTPPTELDIDKYFREKENRHG